MPARAKIEISFNPREPLAKIQNNFTEILLKLHVLLPVEITLDLFLNINSQEPGLR